MTRENEILAHRGLTPFSRRTALGGLIIGGLALAGCGAGPTNGAAPSNGAPVLEESPPSPADYELRMEPFGGTMETAWNYMRERLDSVGSTPQVCDPAYKLTDAARAGGGRLDTQACKEMFPQLSQNLLHVFNFLLANPDLSREAGPFMPALVQDVFAGVDMGGKKPLGPFWENSFIETFLRPTVERLPPGTFITEVSVLDANYTYQHSVVELVGQRPSDPEPIPLGMVEIPHSAPNLVLKLNPMEPYGASTDFDKAVQVGFTP